MELIAVPEFNNKHYFLCSVRINKQIQVEIVLHTLATLYYNSTTFNFINLVW